MKLNNTFLTVNNDVAMQWALDVKRIHTITIYPDKWGKLHHSSTIPVSDTVVNKCTDLYLANHTKYKRH